MFTSQALEAKALVPNGHCVDSMGHVTTLAGICTKCHAHTCAGFAWCKH